MGSNLRIVDVGKNILQFKFNSKYQKEWVERNSSVGNKSILVWKIKGNTQKEKKKRAGAEQQRGKQETEKKKRGAEREKKEGWTRKE